MNTKTTLSILLLFFFATTLAQSGSWEWAKSVNGNSSSTGYSVATDNSGNEYVAGCFFSPAIILGNDTFNNTNTENLFLVKYDAVGNVIWATCPNGNINSLFSNQLGMQVYSSPINPNETTKQLNIPILPSGVYYLKVWGGGNAASMSFVVER